MDNGFIEDGFIVNLSNANSTAEVIYELSSILDMPEAQNKKICLKLENIDLTQSQLLSIKALIESMDSLLEFIDSQSDVTKASADALNIKIYELKNEMEIPQVQPSEEELQKLTAEPKLFESNDDNTAFQELAQEEGLIAGSDIKTYAQMDDDEKPNIELEDDDEDVEKLPTLYLNQTLRSGQTVTSDGNLVIIGDANPGSEIIARGDITVWGVLGGIAHAGSKGNSQACIRALKMNAIQLRIAGFYARRINTENIPFVQKSSTYTPEEARVDGKSIVIKTTYESKEK